MTTTDPYYSKEDDSPDIEQQIVSLETALAQADPLKAATLVSEAGNWLGELYDAAEARGDTYAMTAVSESWTRIQTIQQQVNLSTATAHAAVAGMKAASEQRDEALTELSLLTEAVEQQDYSNPLVSDLMDEVREQTEENVTEWAYQDAYENVAEDAYDDQRSDFVSTLRRTITGLSEADAEALVDALFGWKHTVTVDQVDVLIEYLQIYRANLEA